MAATAATPFPTTIASCSHGRAALIISTSLTASRRRCPKSRLLVSIPQLGDRVFSPWSGLKHLGVSCRFKSKEDKGQRKVRVVYASLFGVGAPEALVIGVVALLVFGPKGLAEVARNLGKTLRAFQPTIRELQDVSREFKSTLEREIGLDEVSSSTNYPYKSSSSFVNEKPQAVADPNGTPPPTRSYSSEELLKRTEEQLSSSAAVSQAQEASSKEKPQAAPASPEVPIAPSTPETSATSEVATQMPMSETDKPGSERRNHS